MFKPLSELKQWSRHDQGVYLHSLDDDDVISLATLADSSLNLGQELPVEIVWALMTELSLRLNAKEQ